ncbi:hypothetical protein [Roseovarius sp. SYSU LYC5161]|uniref:hypothetical protein n=1 Tax=Roseovarius halophilus (ex Wu et al. 2025) TaxID=3376060 RepID=UPI00399BAD6F
MSCSNTLRTSGEGAVFAAPKCQEGRDLNKRQGFTRTDRYRALGLRNSTCAVCLAVWPVFWTTGVKIRGELGLGDTKLGLLVATTVLTGSISRIFLGVWTEQVGGRVIFPLQMLIKTVCVWGLTSVTSYPVFVVAALWLGLAGGSVIVGWSSPGLEGDSACDRAALRRAVRGVRLIVNRS